MSDSSWKVGHETVHQLITRADEVWTAPGAGWDTSDLADFVHGLLEGALEHLVELKPEMVQTCGQDGVRCPEHDAGQHVARVVDLFTQPDD